MILNLMRQKGLAYKHSPLHQLCVFFSSFSSSWFLEDCIGTAILCSTVYKWEIRSTLQDNN